MMAGDEICVTEVKNKLEAMGAMMQGKFKNRWQRSVEGKTPQELTTTDLLCNS